MKQNTTLISKFFAIVFTFTFLVLSGCSEDSGTTTTPTTPTTPTTGGSTSNKVTISGRVSLSGSLVSNKPQMLQKMSAMPKGKPGSKAYMAARKATSSSTSNIDLPLFATSTDIADAYVYLYDSDHPEWLSPVAQSLTDATGNYTLSVLGCDSQLRASECTSLASKNGDAYTDGDPIPPGNYTLFAVKFPTVDITTGIVTDMVVAVQNIVNKFDGSVTGSDLVAQPSDVLPSVVTMFGVKKNTDGTNTWGGSTLTLPTNSAIQVTFSMPMARETLENGISISPAISGGYWAVSPDWLSATYYLPDGTTLSPGTTYTVTVNGGKSNTSAVRNVYGHAIKETRTGSFTTATVTDTQKPTVQLKSPSFTELSNVPLLTPIRIVSNEVLDINKLLLQGTPSLGAKPGVIYVGEDKATPGTYIYEFTLGDPLKASTSYDINVSGGKDMAGNLMSEFNSSFTTEAASANAAIDETADTTTQNAQADIADVLGKWVRSFNDRNVTQLQNMMAGDFVFEYRSQPGDSNEDDLNKDGRFSFLEFSSMIENAFLYWDYCGVTMDAEILQTTLADGSNYYINIVGDKADFKFKFTATTDNKSQDCQDAAPKDEMFANAARINGSWYLSRVSEGVDTRNTALVSHGVVKLVAPTDGKVLSNTPDGLAGITVDFDWEPVSDASSYILVLMNDRDPGLGGALIMPSNYTSLSIPEIDLSTGNIVFPNGSIDISKYFGFDQNRDPGIEKDGETFRWEVIALTKTKPADFDTNDDGVFDDKDDPKSIDIDGDILAISKVYTYTNFGIRKELTIDVGGLTFSEITRGYNAGTAGSLTVTVNTDNISAATGRIVVNGHSWQEFPLNFTGGVATATIDLFQGMNWVEVDDGVDLWEGFTIETEGGTPPAISITDISIQGGSYTAPTSVVADKWGYIDTTSGVNGSGADQVTLTGKIIDTNLLNTVSTGVAGTDYWFNANLGNDQGAWKDKQVVVDATGNFTVTFKLYNYENWININFSDWNSGSWASYNIGLRTEQGATYTPPIAITSVTTASNTGTWGNSSDWDASADIDDVVVISGTMVNVNGTMDPWFNVSSDGGWKDGKLAVGSGGAFEIKVELYNGWNWVSFNDALGNWYGVNIYTSNGKVVIKPEITSVTEGRIALNPVVYDVGTAYEWISNEYQASTCSVEVTIHSEANSELMIYINSDDGMGNYAWEDLSQKTDSNGDVVINLSLLGDAGSGWNNLDIYDKNYMWSGASFTTTGSCAYVAPVMSVTFVNGVAVDPTVWQNFDLQTAGLTYAISGTSNITGKTITATLGSCGGQEKFTTTVDANGDWVVNVTNYQGSYGVDISDGSGNSYWINTFNNDGAAQLPTPVMTASIQGLTPTYEMCGYADYDAGTAATVTIIGNTTQTASSTGTYNAPGGVNGTFNIDANGDFAFDVSLYDGWNNIWVNDANWNGYSIGVNSSNGILPPQYVGFSNPSFDPTTQAITFGTPTPAVIEGWVDIANFTPTRLNASFDDNDGNNYTNYFFSSDPWEVRNNGAIAMNYDATTGNFSIDLGALGIDPQLSPTQTNRWVMLSVNAMDDDTGAWHGVNIDYGDNYAWRSFYKSGQKAADIKASMKQAIRIRNTRSILRTTNTPPDRH